jgi:hypothetical protein
MELDSVDHPPAEPAHDDESIRLWDFGCEQYIINGWTGESLLVYGSDCTVAGGPFTFKVDEYRGVLVGDGDEEDCYFKQSRDLNGLSVYSIK